MACSSFSAERAFVPLPPGYAACPAYESDTTNAPAMQGSAYQTGAEHLGKWNMMEVTQIRCQDDEHKNWDVRLD